MRLNFPDTSQSGVVFPKTKEGKEDAEKMEQLLIKGHKDGWTLYSEILILI